MKRALIPGSFDPPTVGHVDMIERTARLFDETLVVAFDNCEKRYHFDANQRRGMLEAICERRSGREGCGRIVASVDGGLLADYVQANKIDAVVKGARNATDFDYEYWLSLINRSFDSNFETLILPARAEFQHISSTVVRELIKYGKSLRGYVPEEVEEIIKKIKKEEV